MSGPYIPFYIDDFDAATAHLSLAEEGCYMRLMKLAWRSVNCTIVDDLDWIARKTRAPKPIIVAILKEFFHLKNGVWSQKRLKREFDDVRKKISARKKAGKLGGLAKHQKEQEKNPSKASILLKHPEPEPEPEPELESSSQKDGNEAENKVVPIRRNFANPKLPENWPGPTANKILIEMINSPWLDDSKHGSLQSCAEITNWIVNRCDWDFDIVPTVKAVMTNRNTPVTSWGYFTNRVYASRDTRLREGPPIPVQAKPKRTPEELEMFLLLEDFRFWEGKDYPWHPGKRFPGFDKIREAIDRLGNAADRERLQDTIDWIEERKAQ